LLLALWLLLRRGPRGVAYYALFRAIVRLIRRLLGRS